MTGQTRQSSNARTHPTSSDDDCVPVPSPGISSSWIWVGQLRIGRLVDNQADLTFSPARMSALSNSRARRGADVTRAARGETKEIAAAIGLRRDHFSGVAGR